MCKLLGQRSLSHGCMYKLLVNYFIPLLVSHLRRRLESSLDNVVTLFFHGMHRSWTRTSLPCSNISGIFISCLSFMFGIYGLVGMHIFFMGNIQAHIWFVSKQWNLLHIFWVPTTQKRSELLGLLRIYASLMVTLMGKLQIAWVELVSLCIWIVAISSTNWDVVPVLIQGLSC